MNNFILHLFTLNPVHLSANARSVVYLELQVPVDGGLSNNDVATVHGDAQHLRV
jgi:hypothetical protein